MAAGNMSKGKGKRGRKSQIWISAVLYILLVSVVIVIVVEGGTPIMNNLRDKSVFLQTRDNFVSLDKHIKDVSNAGPGSQRVVPLEIKKGELNIKNSQVKWEMDTKASIVQPKTSVKTGNLRLGMDSDVDAYERNNKLILENYYIRAVFYKVGNESSYGTMNSTSILHSITYKTNNKTASGEFSFLIDDSLIESDGYSKLVRKGHDLGSGTVMFYMNTSSGVVHRLYFTLDSRTDFLMTNLE